MSGVQDAAVPRWCTAGYGLAAEGTDVTLADLARLTDVFYIGGTKVGALCGEAVVFPHGAPAHL